MSAPPKSFKDICKWARYLYHMDPVVANAVDYQAQQIIRGFEINADHDVRMHAHNVNLEKLSHDIGRDLLVYGESLPTRTAAGHYIVLNPEDVDIKASAFTDTRRFTMAQGPVLNSDAITHLFSKASPYDVRGTTPLRKYFKYLAADKPAVLAEEKETKKTLKVKQGIRDAVEWWMIERVLRPYAAEHKCDTNITIEWEGGPLWTLDKEGLDPNPVKLEPGQRWLLSKYYSHLPPGVYVILGVNDDGVFIVPEAAVERDGWNGATEHTPALFSCEHFRLLEPGELP